MRSHGGPVRLVGLEFGRFPEVDRLNARFRQGHERLKLTIDVVAAPATSRRADSWLETLQKSFPTLHRHRCCGDRRIQDTVLAEPTTDSSIEETTRTAHLLEHLLIDITHYVGDMTVCSGITCGHVDPPHRYDIFVEIPGVSVARLCVALTLSIAASLESSDRIAPFLRSGIHLARAIRRNRVNTITVQGALMFLDGAPDAADALSLLARHEFIREIESSVNFSGTPLYLPADPSAPRS